MTKFIIKCSRCGNMNVDLFEVMSPMLIETQKVVDMDEYIKLNRSKDETPFSTVYARVSHMGKMMLKCRDCKLEKEWDQVHYT